MPSLCRLLPFVRQHSKHIALSVVLMVFSGLLSAAFFYLFENVLKQILNAQSGQADKMGQVNLFMLVIVVWAAARVLVDFGLTYLTQRTGQRILTQLRSRLFAHLQELPIGYFEKRRTGELMSRLTNDLGALQTVLTTAVTTTIRAPIEVLGALVYMFAKDWQLSLFVFLILPPVAFLVNRAGRKIRLATTALQQQLADLTNFLQEKIAAMRLIQTFGTKNYEIAGFNAVNHEAYKRTMTPIRIQASLAPVIEFVGYMGVLSVLWFGAWRGMEAEKLIVFLFAMHRCAMQFKAIAGLNTQFKSADAAAERLWEVMDAKPEIQDAQNAIELKTGEVRGHLKFENVRFAYEENDVLHDISFEIKPGEVVALAGLSGSGKTTIAALVPRLYDPKAGRVTLDGTDLREISLLSLRAQIGAVPQDVTLFHGTLRENIAYGSPDATLDEIVAASHRAHADEFICTLPEGYDSPIGERGGGFSGGQKQRISIARALLRDPKILILDEATSSLDAESESLVQDALAELMKGRTTLIIAHRFSTIIHADRILVLDKGHIIETGSHTQLLAQQGLYYRLYQMQSFQSKRGDEALDEALSEALDEAPLVSLAK